MNLLPEHLSLNKVQRRRILFVGVLFLILTTPLVVFLLGKQQQAKIVAEVSEISWLSECPGPASCQNGYTYQVCYGFGNIDAQVLDITDNPEGEDVTEDFRSNGWLQVDSRGHQGKTWYFRYNSEPVPRCPSGYYSLWLGALGCKIPRSGEPPLNENDETLASGVPGSNLALLCHNGPFTAQMTEIYEGYELTEIRIEADPRNPNRAGEINLAERLVHTINTCDRVVEIGEEPVPSQDQLSHKYIFVIKGTKELKHTECQDMACVEVDGAGEDKCTLGDDDFCYYYDCEGELCVQKAGAGSEVDVCDPTDPNACKTPTHTECQNMTCVEVIGPGSDKCTLGNDDPCFYYDCEGEDCVKKAGSGDEVDKCDVSDPGACKAPSHLECSDERCVEVDGAGEDECDSDDDCEEESHLECKDEACVEVDGAGEDECDDDDDCEEETHLECEDEACVEVDGAGKDECRDDDDCEETHRECRNDACVDVAGDGEDECSSNMDCAVGAPAPPAQPVPVTGLELPTIIFAALAFILLTAGLLFYF